MSLKKKNNMETILQFAHSVCKRWS